MAKRAAAAKTDKPNILIIWGDDIGWFNVSAYNHGIMGYRTPNIDRIAKEGALLPMPTESSPAQRGGPHLFWANIRFAPVC